MSGEMDSGFYIRDSVGLRGCGRFDYLCEQARMCFMDRYTLRGIALLIMVLFACSCEESARRAPEIVLEVAGGDSLATVLCMGEGVSHREQVAITDSLLRYTPDTTRYRSVHVLLPLAGEAHYYIYTDGAWRSSTLEMSAEESLQSMPSISGRTTGGDYLTVDAHDRRRWAIVFSDDSLRTLSKGYRDSLERRYRPDTLHFVYMMLTPSDREARTRARVDGLGKFVLSDSLETVSLARRAYGIERLATPVVFVLDSLRQRVECIDPEIPLP